MWPALAWPPAAETQALDIHPLRAGHRPAPPAAAAGGGAGLPVPAALAGAPSSHAGGLPHTATTEALDLGADGRGMQRVSRPRDVRTPRPDHAKRPGVYGGAW